MNSTVVHSVSPILQSMKRYKAKGNLSFGGLVPFSLKTYQGILNFCGGEAKIFTLPISGTN